MKSFQQCHKMRHEQSLAARLPLSRSLGPRLAGSTRPTCRGIVDKATAIPSAHKRMTGKYTLDVFGGPGFVAKASNHLGLRGYVLDTKFADVSAGKCVARMISLPRQHTSCSGNVISASAAVANMLHRARMPRILDHPCDSWLWDVPKIETLAAQLRTAWALADFGIFGSPCRKRTLLLVGNVDGRDLHRIARTCA